MYAVSIHTGGSWDSYHVARIAKSGIRVCDRVEDHRASELLIKTQGSKLSLFIVSCIIPGI